MLVVSYYPGAGGHRYLRWLVGREYTTPGITYDGTIMVGIRSDSYMLDDLKQPDDRMMVTHCMNVPHIRSRYPTCKIIQLQLDLYSSLQREWMLLADNYKFNSTVIGQGIDRDTLHRAIDSAFSTIMWHSEYYQKYPEETDTNTQIVKVAEDASPFGQVMRTELGKYSSKIFSIAWDSYQSYGANAPIFDIVDASVLASNSDVLAP